MAKVVKSRKPKPSMRTAKIKTKQFGWDHGISKKPKPRKVKHV